MTKPKYGTKLHCQHCGKLRQMRVGFIMPKIEPESAVTPEATAEDKPGEPKFDWFFVKVRKLKEYLRIKNVARNLPGSYAGFCSICQKTTFYHVNHNYKLELVPVHV